MSKYTMDAKAFEVLLNAVDDLNNPHKVGITDAQVNEDEFVHVDQLNDSLFFVSATQYDMICHFLSFCNVHDINNLDELKEFTFHSLGKGFELKYREPQI